MANYCLNCGLKNDSSAKKCSNCNESFQYFNDYDWTTNINASKPKKVNIIENPFNEDYHDFHVSDIEPFSQEEIDSFQISVADRAEKLNFQLVKEDSKKTSKRTPRKRKKS